MGDFSDIAQGEDLTSSTDKNLLPGHTQQSTQSTSAVLHRTLHTAPPQMVSADEKHIKFSNGHSILDSTCGAGVACIGYTNKRVRQAMIEQIDNFSYCNSMFFGHPIGEELASELVQGTGGSMSKAFVVCSGEYATCQHLVTLGINVHRLRSNGIGNENGSSVLHGVESPAAGANKLHCSGGLVSRYDSGLAVYERTCRPPRSFCRHALAQHRACVGL
jgi:hypothetical protein